jgi:hypothetical protein
LDNDDVAEHLSERRACQALEFRYRSLPYLRRARADERKLRERILELVRQRPRLVTGGLQVCCGRKALG